MILPPTLADIARLMRSAPARTVQPMGKPRGGEGPDKAKRAAQRLLKVPKL